MSNKDLIKVFFVVCLAEMICHHPVKEDGFLVRLRDKLESK